MPRILIPARISGHPPSGDVREFSGRTMGTTWNVKLAAPGLVTSALQHGIQAALDNVVNEMSHWDPASDLGRFNLAPAGSWHRLPEGFYHVLSYALAVAEESAGAYDPAAGALVGLWGFGPAGRHDQPGFTRPDHAAIMSLTERPGWRRIEMHEKTRRVLQPGGVGLDLSSVAKGYGVDQVARYLDKQGIRDFLVEVGGELRGAGMKPDGQPWWVALEQPPEEGRGGNAGMSNGKPDEMPSDLAGADIEPAMLALHGISVATSGDYRRFFVMDGKVYSHTIDPRSGYPLSNGVASVTVLHEECMHADALSTALTVMGASEGLRFAQERGLAARFLIRSDGKLVEQVSSCFLEMLQ